MRRKMIAMFAVLLLASPGWAPPPPPRPPAPPVRPPTAPPVRPPVRPPTTTPVRPPVHVVPPALHASLEAARRRSAAEAAELLRQQSAASISRAHRAAMLNAITHDLLRQKQAASLAELRRLRADWVAVGPGAGLDPIVAMQLEAAESAAERLVLAEILQLVRDGQFASADAKIGAIESPRYLPAAVVQALPELRAALKHLLSFAPVRTALEEKAPMRGFRVSVVGIQQNKAAGAIMRGAEELDALLAAQYSLSWRTVGEKPDSPSLKFLTQQLADVEKLSGAELTHKLRPELAARLFLDGRTDDATKLLEGDVDPVHTAAVLADLKAIMLGRGEITTPQVAESMRADQPSPPVGAVAILPPEQLLKWKPPAHKPGETTVGAAIGDARKQLKVAVDAEVDAGTAKVSAAADRIRAALAAENAPLKAFWEKVEAAHGKPLGAAERQLAAIAGGRGMTVAEVVGVLAVEADRPASAARLLATVPTFGGFGEFAAAVEVSGRAPAGFAAHMDAAFKLTAGRDRARVREAVAAVLNAQAARIAAGREGPELDRAAFEADVHKRLGLEADALAPRAYVQAVLDVCSDWVEDHARLSGAMRELNEFIAGAESGAFPDEPEDELRELIGSAQVRRLSVQADKKRREAGLVIGCRLLGGYGAASAPASAWLNAQLHADTPWKDAANQAFRSILAPK